MRIGIDARLAWRRGVGTYTANLLLALSRVDPYNDYVVFSAPPELKQAIPSKRFRFLDPVSEPSPRFIRMMSRQPAFYEQFWLPSMLAKHDLDLLHYTDNSATATADIPYVVTIHDTMFLRPLGKAYPHATTKQRLVGFYKKAVVPLAARGAMAVITVSEYSSQCIVKELGVAPEDVHVTPEGVDLAFFHPPHRKKKGKKGIPTILVHGAEDERKNMANLLQAASLLIKKGRPVTLTVAGMDERGMERAGLMRLARDRGLIPHLQLLGDVSRQLLREVYYKADVFLYASRWEGFGLPVLEAFACGVPTVVSNTSSLPEVAGDAALQVSPDKPEEMARAVERLLTRPALARQLVRKGLARVQQFTWDRTARMTLGVYRKVALSMEYDRHGRRRATVEE